MDKHNIVDIYNGGITLGIGNYTLKKISSYSHGYEDVSNKFTGYNYTTVSQFIGRRFKASIRTGHLTEDELNELKTALFAHTFNFVSNEFSGMVMLDGFDVSLTNSNIYAKLYTVSFSVSAVAVTGGSGGL